MEAGETRCPILVAQASIPKRDAAYTIETLLWGLHPWPIQGNTPFITAAEDPDNPASCAFINAARPGDLPTNPRMAHQLQRPVSVAFRCANSWAVPLGKK